MRVITLGILVAACLINACQQGRVYGNDDFCSPPTTALDGEMVEQGWIALFDGEGLYGWKPESDVDWHVKDGEIRATSGKVGLLRTTSQFDDYQLRLEFRCPPTTNSGVFLRTSPRPNNPAGDCYELNIAPADNPFPTGSLVARHKSDLGQALQKDDWNQFQLTMESDRVLVQLNGKIVMDYRDRRPLGRGYIGLQYNSGEIAFRNIHLRPLGTQALLDSELSQWNQQRAEQSKFQVAEDVLLVTGGRGQLETKNRFADFVFQTHVRTNAEGLNSGVFFRCIPGDMMNGYESQIQNQFVDGNRAKPKDCGTGGIFRQKNARRVVADDLKWFAKTIVATGPHIGVWVNGYQVSDWSDQRKKDPNPRRGLRTQAGTLILQGHDPTTDISFRQMHIRELTERRPSR